MWDMECQPDTPGPEYVFRIRPAALLLATMLSYYVPATQATL
jgi:hypothetical protein